MAKKNKTAKSAQASGSAASAESSEGADVKSGLSPAGKAMGILLLSVALGLVAWSLWRLRQHPNQRWATDMQGQRQHRWVERFHRCFPAQDGASVRAQGVQARAGTLSPALVRCRGGALTELELAASDMLATVRGAPLSAESAQSREIDALRHVRTSVGHLVRTVNHLPTDNTVPADQRDTLVHQLDEVATDVDAEQRAFRDMVTAAESGVTLL